MTNEMWLDENGAVVGTVSVGRTQELKQLEEERVEAVSLRRSFIDGEQYADRNAERAKLGQTTVDKLPEHEKLHAYATQLSESVDFMATQMSESFSLEGAAESTAVLMEALKASPRMKGGYGKSGVNLTNAIRSALRDSDTPAWVRWDGINEQAWVDVFDTKDVWFVYAQEDQNRLERVVVRQTVWDRDPATTEEVRRVQCREFFMGGQSCVMGVRWEGSDQWIEPMVNLRVPFIPWVTLRATRKDYSNVRGESAVTRQAMEAALRYDAVEQTAYLIARYNSHGNLAVIGDGASLRAQMEEAINKDVADVLTFPGGTSIVALTLPTDPQMIIHQREVLLDEMYGCFGIARLDHGTVRGLGNISGYALEILNRKSNGTFGQIRNQYVGDFKDLLNMILDVTAYRQKEAEVVGEAMTSDADEFDGNQILGDEAREALEARIWKALDELVPEDVFRDRDFEVHLGTGYVVDQVMIREDFTAGLTSRASALRQRGWAAKEIEDNQREIGEESPEGPEQGTSAGAAAAARAAISAAQKNNPSTEDSGE